MNELFDQSVCIPCLWSYEKIDNMFHEFQKGLSIWSLMIELYDPKIPGYELPDLKREDFKKIRLGLKSIKLNNSQNNSIINIEHIDIHYFTECYDYDYTFPDYPGEGKGGNPHCKIVIKILSNYPHYHKQLQQSFYGREKLHLLKLRISTMIEEKLNKLAPKGFLIQTEGVYNILNAKRY